MSAWIDASTGDPYYTQSVGPQTDGTVGIPTVATVAAPVDAGGGAPGQYAPLVLDTLKFGLGIWNSQVQQQNLLDYRRWEATNLGIFQYGRPAATFTGSASVGGANLLPLLLIGALVFVAIK